MTAGRTIGTLENVIKPEYREHMERSIERGECPFCVVDEAINPILRQGEYWRIWHNPFPYRYHKLHLVLTLKRHVTDLSSLVPDEWKELGEIIAWAARKFDIPGGAFVMRFGDPKLSASTLNHLHAHIQVPDGTGPAFAVFCKERFPIIE